MMKVDDRIRLRSDRSQYLKGLEGTEGTITGVDTSPQIPGPTEYQVRLDGHTGFFYFDEQELELIS